MSMEEQKVRPSGPVSRGLWWLIAGRFATYVVLGLAGAFWIRDRLDDGGRGALRSTLPIFIAALALSVIYGLSLRFFNHLLFQASFQLYADVFLITWLVVVTGDVRSPYTVLYIIVIAVASIFLGPRGALVTSVACAAAFTFTSLAVTTGVVASSAPEASEPSTIRAIQIIGLDDVAFLVVGLLAARLAERQSRSDVRLMEATQTLANLRALHERIVESIRAGVVTTDLRGRIYTFNAAAEEITGYKAADVRGQEASILFGELTDQIAHSMDATTSGEPNPRFEADCLTAEGLRLRLGFTISPLYAETGEMTGRVITFQDLTQIRALEDTSRRQDRLAAVGRLAASIAHEIRNPLAAMRGAIQVLRSEVEGDSSQAELMEIILRESDRLNRIISDYLTYARPRSSSLASVDVRELLHETFTLLRHSPETRPDHVLADDLPDEPALAHADASQLKQVFWNLARNALQAMPNGGALRAELSRLASGRLRITFIDRGRGMSPEQVERLFEPFSSSTSGGTGLGLSIVYQIIRDHGGTINVRSRQGEGTTITIELPGSP